MRKITISGVLFSLVLFTNIGHGKEFGKAMNSFSSTFLGDFFTQKSSLETLDLTIKDPEVLALESRLVTNRLWGADNGGFVGGGGGSGLNFEGEFLLLDLIDFLELYPKYYEMNQKNRLVYSSESSKSSIFQVPIFQTNGELDRHISLGASRANDSFYTSEAFYLAKSSLKKYGLITSLALQEVDLISWKMTRHSPETQYRFSARINSKGNIETIAYYYAKKETINQKTKRAVVISIPRWNRLSFFDQVGLIVHEGLRSFQISFLGVPSDPEYSEKSLQKATLLLTMCKYDSYIENYLMRLLSRYNGSFGGIEGLGEGYSYNRALASCYIPKF